MDTYLPECLSCYHVIMSISYFMVVFWEICLTVWSMDPNKRITKNETPGAHPRPHESESLGGTQHSPCPTGFSEDSYTQLRPETLTRGKLNI